MKCFANEVIFPDFVASATGHIFLRYVVITVNTGTGKTATERALCVENSVHCLTMLTASYKCKSVKLPRVFSGFQRHISY